MTVDSPSPAPARAAERPSVDLAAAGLLPPLPRAYLEGRDRDLLEPLRFLEPGALPEPVPDAPRPDRRRLAEGLRSANRAYGHPGAERLGDLLADPETAVVVGGQQPGLFGGPLYTLAKMVAIGRWAEAIEKAPGGGGRPAVPVFWVATEDHDWAEVARATFLTPEGPRRFDLGEDPDPLLPVGMRTLGPGVTPILEALAELRSGERFERWIEALARIYRPDARFGEAFSRWAVAVLGERCPLLLDAMDPTVKEAEAPWLARLVERRAEWEEASEAADRQIEERGHTLQVHPQRGASPLFELRGGERRRIEWSSERAAGAGEGGAYRLRGSEAPPRPVADLLEVIADNPAAVSPGVLARPAVQDAILGTTLQVLGPGELSYMAQAAPAYRVLEVAAPWVALRPQTLVLEAHHREKLEELGLPLAALLGSEEELERALAGTDGAGFVSRARSEVDAVLAGIRKEALALDPDLERPFEKTRENLQRALETFAGKVTAVAARRDQVRSARVDRLRGVCRPEGALQERVVSSSDFPGKHGERFAEALWEQMELDGRRLQVIEP